MKKATKNQVPEYWTDDYAWMSLILFGIVVILSVAIFWVSTKNLLRVQDYYYDNACWTEAKGEK